MFSPLNNDYLLDKSWAEIVEEEMARELNKDKQPATQPSTVECAKRSRKATNPKKVSTRPKFVRSPETAALSSSTPTKKTRGPTIVTRSQPTEEIRRKRLKREIHSSDDDENDDDYSQQSKKRIASNEHDRPTSGAANSNNMVHQSRPTSGADNIVDRSTSSRLSTRCASSSDKSKDFHKPEHWAEPKLGWCTDESTLSRRTKEIEKAKQKPVYARYLIETPKANREKGVHPRTPNKHIGYSRRSWDAQLRNWKRSLYIWAGEDPSNVTDTSFSSSSSTAGSVDDYDYDDDDSMMIKPNIQSLLKPTNKREETDAAASLLGHFDIDSRRGGTMDDKTLQSADDKTLTGVGERRGKTVVTGPLDFSKV